MPTVSIHLESAVARSFRVEQVAGLFDVQLQKRSAFDLEAPLPATRGDAFGDWRIGAIVGPSGSGKSTVARQAFGNAFINGYTWPRDKAVVDAFPQRLDIKIITGTLTAVGFSSPPAWILPYRVLSTGQQFRCNLARALISAARRDGHSGLVCFDEFTSVVDRQVGRFASAAVAKAVRADRVPCRQFVAVTCHYDVLDWLEPDWVLDMANATLARGSLRRPPIRLSVRRCAPRVGVRLWPVFARHHYLSGKLHGTARCYVAIWEGEERAKGLGPRAKGPDSESSPPPRPEALGPSPCLLAFCATIHNYGHRDRRIVHRLVVLPDFQGMGIGIRLLEAVASIEGTDAPISIRTSHPALVGALQMRPTQWRRISLARGGSYQGGLSRQRGYIVGSWGRPVVSFEWLRE